jgi:hypothetical protein
LDLSDSFENPGNPSKKLAKSKQKNLFFIVWIFSYFIFGFPGFLFGFRRF